MSDNLYQQKQRIDKVYKKLYAKIDKVDDIEDIKTILGILAELSHDGMNFRYRMLKRMEGISKWLRCR